MSETVPTITRLLKEHQMLRESLNVCQVTVDDIALTGKVETAQSIFTPGRLEDHRKKAIELEKELMSIETDLRDHFRCEEQSLLEDFRESKIDRIVTILGELITEHEGILRILADLRRDVAELAVSKASVASWHDKAWQVKPVMMQLVSTIKDHAGREEVLYKEAEALIKGRPKNK
jgi:iron-sulfur cluster repair protein YtfE (RIC family)